LIPLPKVKSIAVKTAMDEANERIDSIIKCGISKIGNGTELNLAIDSVTKVNTMSAVPVDF
jgi:hypothetical protein